MAGRGPAPTDPEKRRRRNAEPVPETVVAADGEIRGPDLPDTVDWQDSTVAWWDAWRRSAQAAVFTDTDWSFLLDTALLHTKLWAGESAVAAELRLRVAKFGATPEDRLRLRMSVAAPEPETARPTGRKSRYEHLRSA
ncbi:MAG: hypothetical protein ABIS86_16965 [Streptosporangiaceae bacterium]